MRKQVLYRAAAATVLGLSLSTGVVAADTGNINHTGYKSFNLANTQEHNASTVTNTNTVGAVNNTTQKTTTGTSLVTGNRDGGNAATGDATGYNTTDAKIQLNTDAATTPSTPVTAPANSTVSSTGIKSINVANTETSTTSNVTDTNAVSVSNTTSQTTVSGNATVVHNGQDGNAATGDATSSNTSSFTISATD